VPPNRPPNPAQWRQLQHHGVFATHNTCSVLHWLATEQSPDTYVNLMDQYHPAHKAEAEPQFSEINRRLSRPEFRQALAYAEEVGLWRLDAREPAAR
jgi:uncharacterized Fe-S radical SAM superfamily protein PflX